MYPVLGIELIEFKFNSPPKPPEIGGLSVGGLAPAEAIRSEPAPAISAGSTRNHEIIDPADPAEPARRDATDDLADAVAAMAVKAGDPILALDVARQARMRAAEGHSPADVHSAFMQAAAWRPATPSAWGQWVATNLGRRKVRAATSEAMIRGLGKPQSSPILPSIPVDLPGDYLGMRSKNRDANGKPIRPKGETKTDG